MLAIRSGRRIVTFAASFLVGACAEDSASSESGITPQDIAGIYVLESWDGRSLPVQTTHFVEEIPLLQATFSSVLVLEADGKFTITSDREACFPRFCTETNSSSAGVWQLLLDGTLNFPLTFVTNGSTRQPARAKVSGNALDLCVVEGNNACSPRLVFRRYDGPPRQVSSVDLRPDSLTVVVGQTHNVFGTATPFSFDVMVVVRDPNIAAVTGGAVLGLVPGTTYVVASVGQARDSAKVVVVRASF